MVLCRYMDGPEVCNWNIFDGYMHGPEVCNWNNFDGYMHGPEVCNWNNFDEYKDTREVCISMNELEMSVQSLVASSYRSQQEVSDEDLVQTSSAANYWILHKVPYMLRQVNEKAYVPRLISIGPYHHGKEHLKAMEDVKRSYFSRMIEGTGVEPNLFVDAMMEEEEAIRKRYEGPLDHIDPHTFVNMLVFDGCFILQLFRDENDPGVRRQLSEGDDFQIKLIHLVNIRYDLLLLENQLPFSVLLKLYSIMRNAGQQEIKAELHRLARRFFGRTVLSKHFPLDTGDSNLYPDYHLLGLVHDRWLSSRSNRPRLRPRPEPKSARAERIIIDVCGSRKFISCATDLARSGINFKKKCEKCEKNMHLLDIDFAEDAKELKIPTLVVDDNTEIILRNMMAYEQFIINEGRPTLFCDYATFMDNLIDSGKDVKLLREAEVIENWLGNDETVAKMFNKLRDFTYLTDHYYFHYDEPSKKVKEHCRKRRYKWLAALKRDYFNSPWSSISFFAAFFLLSLTAAQTIFSVLSYIKQ